jgi:hypothetical protein
MHAVRGGVGQRAIVSQPHKRATARPHGVEHLDSFTALANSWQQPEAVKHRLSGGLQQDPCTDGPELRRAFEERYAPAGACEQQRQSSARRTETDDGDAFREQASHRVTPLNVLATRIEYE